MAFHNNGRNLDPSLYAGTKQQSKQWIGQGKRAPIQAKSVASAGNVIEPVFSNAKGILLNDYLEKGKTITEDYDASVLDRLDRNREQSPGIAKKEVLFHDIALVHSN